MLGGVLSSTTATAQDSTALLVADEPLYRAFDRIGERYGVNVYYHPEDVPFFAAYLPQGQRNLYQILSEVTRGTNLLVVKYDSTTYVVAPSSRQSSEYAEDVVEGWRSGRYRSPDDQVQPVINVTLGSAGDRVVDSEDILFRGTIIDAEDGEPLFGATLFDPQRNAGTSTELDGSFSLRLPARDTYFLEVRLIGYELQPLLVAALGNTATEPLSLKLVSQITGLDEVVVTARDVQRLQREAAGGVRAVSLRELKTLPVLTGDLDVLQAVTTTAGVSSISEGSSGISVRGGALDQNLILQGGMPVLYPAHALGFFPLFHPDLVGGVDLYRGYVPPEFGGRASSVVDVSWRTGDMERWRATGSGGLFASRLAVEGPIVRKKVSLLVGARTSYLNWALYRVRNRNVRTSSVNFSDLSAKLTGRWRGGKVDVQGAYATDKFTYAGNFGYSYTNFQGRVAVNQRLGKGWLGQLEAARSTFGDEQLELRAVPGQSSFFTGLELSSARASTRYDHEGGEGGSGGYSLEVGVEVSEHVTPDRALVPEPGSPAEAFSFRDPALRNYAAYAQTRYVLGPETIVEGGLRVSLAETRRAAGDRYTYDGPPALVRLSETSFSESGTSHRHPLQLEPRVSLTQDLGDRLTAGVAYSRLVQPLSQLTPTVSPTPTDVFLMASEYLALTKNDGVSVTLVSRPTRGERSLGAELAGYYRLTEGNHLAREGVGLRRTGVPERSVYTASGYAYGAELTLRAVGLRNSLALAYAYGRSWIDVDTRYPEMQLQPAARFSAPTDLPHQINLNFSHEPSERVSLNVAWTFTSGRPFTATDGLLPVSGTLVPVFGAINLARLPPTHRLDMGFQLDNTEARRRGFRMGFAISLYNVYGRENPFLAFYRFERFGRLAANQFAIVGDIIPAINLTFQWD